MDNAVGGSGYFNLVAYTGVVVGFDQNIEEGSSGDVETGEEGEDLGVVGGEVVAQKHFEESAS